MAKSHKSSSSESKHAKILSLTRSTRVPSLPSDTAPKVTINDRDALGIGSYGKVVRAKIGKQHCAAKLLHDTMFLFNDPGLQNFVRKFGEECRLLSRIDHPNIVKYLGTTRDPKTGRTVLLMELMHESLTKFLERSPESGPGPLPYYPQFSIGHDIALALDYLHLRSIVHRDLSSNNVLLTADSAAKVTDFGMSRLIEMTPKATPLTQCPGTLAYMPPEALLTPPQYSDRLDCFSFGVLTIQIATRKFPDPGNANKYVEDPKYPSGRVIVQIPEVERRKKHIDLVEPDHPLLPLVIKCLRDRDTERPSAHEICEVLAPLKAQEQAKEEEEAKKQQLKREQEETERQRRKELEEQARKEEIRRQKEEKEKEREARRAAKAAARAEAAGQSLNDSTKLSARLFIPSSKKKPRRLKEDVFDLDLTYILPNIIAMAFPCEKVESLFRNNIVDVVKYLDLKHLDHYKVYNICSERSYDPGRFHQRVATYPFDEDNPPPFELMKPFCDDVDNWLKKNDQNVAVIHCDDGLGRTGTVVASYLLHYRVFDISSDALQFFGEARTQTSKGVTIPSQRRYVLYYSHLLANKLDYSPQTVLLEGIRLEGIPHFGSGGCSLRFAVYLYKSKIFVSKVFETNKRTTDKFLDLSLDQPVPLCGDIKIVFYNKRTRIFRFWFNTFFVHLHQENHVVRSFTDSDTRVIVLPKEELDIANEDTKHYPPNFEVRLMIAGIPDDSNIASFSDYEIYDDEDLSDTDLEDEWEAQTV